MSQTTNQAMNQASNHAMNDNRMEAMMGRLLRSGVFLAAAIVLIGGILFVLQQHNQSADFTHFHGTPLSILDFSSFLPQLAHGSGTAIIELGLIALILTPIARVVFALVAFLMERDALYAAISLFILAILLYGLLLGR